VQKPLEADALSIEQNLSNQLLNALRGAQVGPKEQELFNKSLPQIDQPKPLFRANVDTTMRNLATLQRKAAQQRPFKPAIPPGNDRKLREDAALRALRGR
jgi:hypothetical protein